MGGWPFSLIPLVLHRTEPVAPCPGPGDPRMHLCLAVTWPCAGSPPAVNRGELQLRPGLHLSHLLPARPPDPVRVVL